MILFSTSYNPKPPTSVHMQLFSISKKCEHWPQTSTTARWKAAENVNDYSVLSLQVSRRANILCVFPHHWRRGSPWLGLKKKWKCSLLFLTSRLVRPEAHVVTKPTGWGDDEGCRTEIKILLRDYEPSHPGKCEKFQSEREWNLHLTLSWFDTLRRLIASLSERFWAVSNSFNHLSRAERTVSPTSLPSPSLPPSFFKRAD